MKLSGILLLLVLGCALGERKLYSGYKLIRVVPLTDLQVETLKNLENDFVELDFWKPPSKGHICDINIPPTHFEYVDMVLRSVKITPEVIHADVQRLIDQSHASLYNPRVSRFNEIVGTFPRHQNVEQWLEEKANTFSDLAKIEDIGTTYEGRTQRIIKIGAPHPKGEAKPILWIDSGIHAREWLTVGTSIWIINKMLSTYNTDNTVRALMDHYDWYFLPIANPDGYEYTHTNDRLWRKTTTPNSGSSCIGTDPNRNWDMQWRVSGTSSNPCSTTYGGPYAFSEPCVINMKNKLLQIASRTKLYMAIHSYSQMWLTPWAWGGSKPSDYSDLLRVANSGNSALRAVHGKRFEVGTPPDILYAASGGAYDWAKDVARIKYTYTFELRPDGNAWNGFVVSESEIQPSGEEIWASLAQVAQDIM